MIETGGAALEMPLADHGRLIAHLLQELGKGLLFPIEANTIVNHAVEMAVLAGENDGPARGADRIGAEAVVEQHSLAGQPVELRGFVDLRSVTGQRVRGMVVSEYQNDVGPFRGGEIGTAAAPEKQAECGQTAQAGGDCLLYTSPSPRDRG